MKIEHDTVVQVPTHGAIFDALVNANLLVQLATEIPREWWESPDRPTPVKGWPVYGIYDDSGDWLEVWIKSEAQWEQDRYN
jgi:hypothetical protein